MANQRRHYIYHNPTFTPTTVNDGVRLASNSSSEDYIYDGTQKPQRQKTHESEDESNRYLEVDEGASLHEAGEDVPLIALAGIEQSSSSEQEVHRSINEPTASAELRQGGVRRRRRRKRRSRKARTESCDSIAIYPRNRLMWVLLCVCIALTIVSLVLVVLLVLGVIGPNYKYFQCSMKRQSSSASGHPTFCSESAFEFRRLWAELRLEEIQRKRLESLIYNISNAIGPTGPRGFNGSDGRMGPPGLKGSQGPIGPRGYNGSDGMLGPRGYNGSQGPMGVPGYNGSKLPTGFPRYNGSLWPVCPPACKGDQGLRGPPGNKGPQGQMGPPGFNGTQGPMGPPGFNGSQGPIGPSGCNSSQGSIIGPDYNRSKGPPGRKGDPGPRVTSDLSQCKYKQKKTEYKATTLYSEELRNEVVTGVTCSCDGKSVFTQLSAVENRFYTCHCDKTDTSSRSYCRLHYWTCPRS